MEGSSVSEGRESTLSSSTTNSYVLVGRTGNGKSATGNSILGNAKFVSKSRPSSVTKTCELNSGVLQNGKTVNIVDTPGLFDTVDSPGLTGKEIVRCIELCKDGIHAVLIVISANNRFTKEETDACRNLERLFGPNIFKYTIVILTGGDVLERNGDTLEEYLEYGSDPLKELLELCNGRVVLFNNLTQDEHIKHDQLHRLLFLADVVLSENGGQPYTDEMFNNIKGAQLTFQSDNEMIDSLQGYSEEYILELKEDMASAHKFQLERMTEMIEEKMRATTSRLEEELGQEQAARKEAELLARSAQMEYEEKTRQLRETLQEAIQRDQAAREELQKRFEEERLKDKAAAQQALKDQEAKQAALEKSFQEARRKDQATAQKALEDQAARLEAHRKSLEKEREKDKAAAEKEKKDQAAANEALRERMEKQRLEDQASLMRAQEEMRKAQEAMDNSWGLYNNFLNPMGHLFKQAFYTNAKVALGLDPKFEETRANKKKFDKLYKF